MLRGRLLIAMALLQSSGAISFSDIKGMYGGSTNVSIGDYIKSGSFVPTAPSSSNIPTTKADMSLSKFYSTAKEYVITVAATTTNYDWQTAFAAAYPSPSRSTDYIARLIVNSGVTVGATATSSPALTVGAFPTAARLYIDNYGSIRGAGGAGASLADGDGISGGTALNADVAQTTTITIKNGGSIYGGGGGGGKGGAGVTGGKGGNGTYSAPGAEQYVRTQPAYYAWYSSNTNNPATSITQYYNMVVNGTQYLWGYTFPTGWAAASYKASEFSQAQTSEDISAWIHYYAVQQTTTQESIGGTGGTGGAGGNGGRGAGYNQTVANGDGGSTGTAGNAGGTNAGTGGTGGTGGSGGNGGGLGSAGFSGNTGNQGATGGGGGAAGASGASGTTAGSAGRSVFKNGRSTVKVTVESGGAILPGAA